MDGLRGSFALKMQLLATDIVPDERATLSIRAIMEQQQEDMSRLDRDVSRSRAQISQLYTQRASIEKSYEMNKAILAPVRKLPPEILGEIFIHCLPGYQHSCSLEFAPLLVMRVCRRWRRIATGTPRLWTNFDDGLLDCRFFRMWLSNSGSLPITLSLSPGRLSGGFSKNEVAQLIVGNLGRLGSISWDIDETFYKELSRHGHPIDAPLLEACSFEHNAAIRLPPPELKASIRAPRLSSVSISNFAMLDLFAFDPLSLRKIRLTLWHGPGDPVTSLQFLMSCPDITSLYVCFNGGRFGFDGRFVFPHLTALKILYCPDSQVCTFLDAIDTPGLQELYISQFDPKEPLPRLMPALFSLLGEDPPLQDLTFNGFGNLDPAQYLTMITKCRGIRSLSFEECIVDHTILRALTRDTSLQSKSWICPELTTLDFSYAAFSWDCLIDTVKSRAPIPANVSTSQRQYLQHLYVRRYSDWEPLNESHAAALEDIGLQSNGLLEIFSEDDSGL